MGSIERPPSDITPERFFEQWLPAEYRKLREAAKDHTVGRSGPPDVVVGIGLSGDGGGDWTLTMKAGELSAARGAPAAAGIGLAQSVADWRAMIVGEAGGVDFAPRGGSPMNMLMGDSGAAELLAQLRGTIRFEIGGFNGRTWNIAVTFAGAAEPAATIAVDAETYGQMLSGTLPAPQAYFSGKIIISGDVNFAMQLGMAMMARMSR